MDHRVDHELKLPGSGDYVFVSYARPDEKAAKAIIKALEQSGFSVWWDGLIPGGERFGAHISAALEGARAVVVLWSANASRSDWVKDEASYGRDRHRLIPLSIDGSEPPLGFRQFQCIDISKAGARRGSPAMQRAIAALAEIMGRSPIEPEAERGVARIDRRTAIRFGAAVAVAGGGFAAWRLLAPAATSANSIAVLPFENLSGDAAKRYLSDGLAAELRARLARNSLLSVVGQASSNAFRDRPASSATIARKLGVANLLDGNVRADNSQVRIAVELIDGSTGFSKWSQSFDRPMTNLLEVQSEIAAAVSAALAAELGGDEARARSGGTSSVAAFEYFLRGKDLFDSQRDESSDRGALAHFTDAIRQDPDYAAARAARARTLAVIANQHAQAVERKILYDQAVAEAREAIARAPGYPEGHAALGYALFYGKLDVKAAAEPYRKAYELGGGSPDVLNVYALYQARRRQYDQALPAIERAINLDPLNTAVAKTQGRIRFASGDYAGAIASARRGLELNPNLGGAHGDIGNALLMTGKLDEAAKAFAQESVMLLAIPGRAIVAIKRKADASAGAALDELRRSEGDNGLYQQAQILAQWGKIREALDSLDRARAAQDSGLVYLLSDPFLEPLHREERFNTLLRQLHFV
jgi:TolB-like protein/Tfp pilus assembly protein PilF